MGSYLSGGEVDITETSTSNSAKVTRLINDSKKFSLTTIEIKEGEIVRDYEKLFEGINFSSPQLTKISFFDSSNNPVIPIRNFYTFKNIIKDRHLFELIDEDFEELKLKNFGRDAIIPFFKGVDELLNKKPDYYESGVDETQKKFNKEKIQEWRTIIKQTLSDLDKSKDSDDVIGNFSYDLLRSEDALDKKGLIFIVNSGGNIININSLYYYAVLSLQREKLAEESLKKNGLSEEDTRKIFIAVGASLESLAAGSFKKNKTSCVFFNLNSEEYQNLSALPLSNYTSQKNFFFKLAKRIEKESTPMKLIEFGEGTPSGVDNLVPELLKYLTTPLYPRYLDLKKISDFLNVKRYYFIHFSKPNALLFCNDFFSDAFKDVSLKYPKLPELIYKNVPKDYITIDELSLMTNETLIEELLEFTRNIHVADSITYVLVQDIMNFETFMSVGDIWNFLVALKDRLLTDSNLKTVANIISNSADELIKGNISISQALLTIGSSLHSGKIHIYTRDIQLGQESKIILVCPFLVNYDFLLSYEEPIGKKQEANFKINRKKIPNIKDLANLKFKITKTYKTKKIEDMAIKLESAISVNEMEPTDVVNQAPAIDFSRGTAISNKNTTTRTTTSKTKRKEKKSDLIYDITGTDFNLNKNKNPPSKNIRILLQKILQIHLQQKILQIHLQQKIVPILL